MPLYREYVFLFVYRSVIHVSTMFKSLLPKILLLLTECPSWSCGMNCLQRCDTFCSGNASCNHITGICNKGCKQGWNGPLCDKGIVSWDFFRSRM